MDLETTNIYNALILIHWEQLLLMYGDHLEEASAGISAIETRLALVLALKAESMQHI